MSESDNLPQVLAGLRLEMAQLDIAFGTAADEISQALVGAAQRQIKGDRKNKPYPATPGAPPMNVTGNLRRSIKGKSTRNGFGIYTAEAGAYMVYARAVEFGGAPTWTRGQRFPYMQPALEVFKRTNLIRTILIKHLRRA
jgi:hypothetical protein